MSNRYWPKHKVILDWRVMRYLAAIAAALAGQGCTAVLPNTVTPEIVHMSHATQHAPVTTRPTDYGSELAQVTLEWKLPSRFVLSASDGVDLDKRWSNTRGYGEIQGPREQFTAKFGYQFGIH